MTTSQLDDTGHTLVVPEVGGGVPPTPRAELDRALATLAERAKAWTQVGLDRRIELLRTLADDTVAAAPAWCTRAAEVKGIRRDSPLMAEEWLTGPYLIVRYLKQLQHTLEDIGGTGRPQPPAIGVGPDGQAFADVFPPSAADRLLFPGFTGRVRFLPEVTLERATAEMGRIYRDGHTPEPGVALVLGAGNVSVIGPTDVLHQLFARNHVVVLKMNPTNEYLGPHLAEAFQALVREGYLRVVYGGSDVGAYLTDHDEVDTIHITGSDRTHDAIVFGTGDEGARRKAEGTPRLTKEVTSELGNVSPVIVVPGPWSGADLAYHGDYLASMLVGNAGFNCLTARMIVQHRAWAKRGALVDAVRDSLRRAEPREAYYPGARERWERFVETHRSAEWFGDEAGDRVPFTILPDLDPSLRDDIAFRVEPFCGLMGEVGLDTPRSVPDYLDAAVEFCNDTLWGTLAATIIVHPRSLEDPGVAGAVERAIDRLRYGTVAVNHWGGIAFGLLTTPWGGYPGSPPTDIQSGRGFVHNSYLLEGVEKAVVRGPFRTPYTPIWFHRHRHLAQVAPDLTRFTASEDWKLLPAALFHALRP